MIRPDETFPNVAVAPHDEIEGFLDAIAGGESFDGADTLPDALVEGIGEILTGASGTADVTLSDPQGYSTHGFTLSRAGVLRRSRGLSDREDIAVHPTSTLPGLLLRLSGISPVEPLFAEATVDAPEGAIPRLFSGDSAERDKAWEATTSAGQSLPESQRADFEHAAPRAARLTRHRPEGSRTAVVILLRGRYLTLDTDGTTLRGTSPTGAARALMSALLKP